MRMVNKIIIGLAFATTALLGATGSPRSVRSAPALSDVTVSPTASGSPTQTASSTSMSPQPSPRVPLLKLPGAAINNRQAAAVGVVVVASLAVFTYAKRAAIERYLRRNGWLKPESTSESLVAQQLSNELVAALEQSQATRQRVVLRV